MTCVKPVLVSRDVTVYVTHARRGAHRVTCHSLRRKWVFGVLGRAQSARPEVGNLGGVTGPYGQRVYAKDSGFHMRVPAVEVVVSPSPVLGAGGVTE